MAEEVDANGFSGLRLSDRERLTDSRVAERLIRGYVVRVCGRKALTRVSQHALARLGEPTSDRLAARPAADRLREAARDAALAEAGRSARRIRVRLRHLVRGRVGHEKVPELLRRRAAGSITTGDLGWLYTALENCPDCRRIALRVAAGESHLNRALNEGHAAGGPAAPRPAPAATTAAGRSAVSSRERRAATTGRRRSPPRSRGGAGGRRLGVLGAVFVVAGVASATLALDRHAGRSGSPSLSSPSPSSAPALVTPLPSLRLTPSTQLPSATSPPSELVATRASRPADWILG